MHGVPGSILTYDAMRARRRGVAGVVVVGGKLLFCASLFLEVVPTLQNGGTPHSHASTRPPK